jgi:ATP-dependent Lon protease
MATALISALTRRPVSRDVALTGEITLRGRVLAIGGLKEKSLAAYRAGIKTVIVPDRNQKDLDELPKVLRRKLKFIAAKNMSDVLKVALLDKETAARRTKGTVLKSKLNMGKNKLLRRNQNAVRKRPRDRSVPLRP